MMVEDARRRPRRAQVRARQREEGHPLLHPPRRGPGDPDRRRRGGAPVARPRERARPRQEVRPLAGGGAGTAHRRQARSVTGRPAREAPGRAALAHGLVVVGAAFVCVAVIFGVAYSFAAFFRSFGSRVRGRARRRLARVRPLGADLLPARRRRRHARRPLRAAPGVRGRNAVHRRRSAREQLRAVDGGDLRRLGRGPRHRHRPRLRAVDRAACRRGSCAGARSPPGIASAGIGVGTLAVPLLATAAIAALGWRHALQALAAGVVVVGVGATLLLRRAPARAAPGTAAVRDDARARRSAAVASGGCTRRCVLAAPAMFIPFAHVSAAARDLGIGDARAVGLVGLIGVGSIVGRFAIGGFADRLGRIASIALLEASLGACYLLWLAAGGYGALALFALWLGLSYGGIVSLMPASAWTCSARAPSRASSARSTAARPSATCSARSSPARSSIAPAATSRSSGPASSSRCSRPIASAQLLRDRRPTY